MGELFRIASLSGVLVVPALLGLVVFDSLLVGVGSRLARLGLAFVGGAALLCTSILLTESVLGIWVGYPPVLFGASAGCVVVLIRRMNGAWHVPAAPDGWAGRVLAGSVVLVVGLLLADAACVPPVDWDGVMTWLPFARMIAEEQTSRPSVLLDGQAWFVNPQYPPAVPVLNAILPAMLGADVADERNLRLLSIGFLCGFLAVVYSLAEALGGRHAGRIGVCLALTTQMVITEPKGGALGEYADLPLASFVGIILLLLVKRGAAPWPLPAFVVSLAMTKAEGLPIAAGLTLAVLVLGARADGRRGALVAVMALGALLAGGLRARWQEPIPVRNAQEYSLSALTKTAKVVENVRRAVPLVIARMTPGRRWGALWLLTLVAALWSVRQRRLAPPTGITIAALGIPLTIGMLAYAAHWDAGRVVPVTWDRFLLQASVPAFSLTSAFLAWCLREVRVSRGENDGAAPCASPPAAASTG